MFKEKYPHKSTRNKPKQKPAQKSKSFRLRSHIAEIEFGNQKLPTNQTKRRSQFGMIYELSIEAHAG